MAWVWNSTKESDNWGADIDYEQSAPFSEIEAWSDIPLALDSGRAIYRSRSSLKRFKQFHCPPIGTKAIVDHVWRDIILKFVPANRIQFYPVRLVARGEICDDYMWVITFERARCIDVKRSIIVRKVESAERTVILGVEKFVHHDQCLGKLHLARDVELTSHLLVSDELKDALSATGESSMFYQPEDVVTFDNIFLEKPSRLVH